MNDELRNICKQETVAYSNVLSHRQPGRAVEPRKCESEYMVPEPKIESVTSRMRSRYAEVFTTVALS